MNYKSESKSDSTLFETTEVFEKLVKMDYIVYKLFCKFEKEKLTSVYHYKNYKLLENICETIKKKNNSILSTLCSGKYYTGFTSYNTELYEIHNIIKKYFTTQNINELKSIGFIDDEEAINILLITKSIIYV